MTYIKNNIFSIFIIMLIYTLYFYMNKFITIVWSLSYNDNDSKFLLLVVKVNLVNIRNHSFTFPDNIFSGSLVLLSTNFHMFKCILIFLLCLWKEYITVISKFSFNLNWIDKCRFIFIWIHRKWTEI